MNIGAHVTIAKGLIGAVEAAHDLGATTFQIFSRNPRGRGSALGKLAPAALNREIERATELRRQYGIRSFYIHTPYYTNLASPVEKLWRQSIISIVTDLALADKIGSNFFVMHIGHHMGRGIAAGIKRVVAGLKEIKKIDKSKTKLLLEITAGQGTEVGNNLKEIGQIIDQSGWAESKIGIVLDTAHAFGAGYDLRTPAGIRVMLKELDREIGLSRLFLIHANDSLGEIGSHKDRHAHIGEGKIGAAGFKFLLRQKTLVGKDFIVETPSDQVKLDIEKLKKYGSE